MHIRSVVAVNIALMSALVFMDTGCRTKAGGWRWPWQKDTSLVNDPALANELDVPAVKDEARKPVSGSRFEDTLQPVQGVKFLALYFAFDSYALAPSEISKIEQVAQHLQQNATHVLVIEGHCDERGSNEYNLRAGRDTARSRSARTWRTSESQPTASRPAATAKRSRLWPGRARRRGGSTAARGEFALYQK
jgi:outer membrane protein OmpA-like peptidoglycan-associated protein